MPIFTTGLYEVRLRQEIFQQECINLFYYRDDETGPAVGLEAIGNAFNADVYALIIEIQNEAALGVDLRIRKFGGGIEALQTLTNQDGTRMGDSTASFNAWGFILNRTNIDIRNGAKRFTGVSEMDAEGNVPTAAIENDLDAVAAAMQARLILANTAELTPVIYRRDSFIDPDWFGSVVADSAFRKITSQVSRKFQLE